MTVELHERQEASLYLRRRCHRKLRDRHDKSAGECAQAYNSMALEAKEGTEPADELDDVTR